MIEASTSVPGEAIMDRFLEETAQGMMTPSCSDAQKAYALGLVGIVPHNDSVMGTTVDEIVSRHIMTADVRHDCAAPYSRPSRH
jgi:hypothetical protein